ncbi:MAG: hypothetical protein ACRCXT_17930 [Paraclostridium sp.]
MKGDMFTEKQFLKKVDGGFINPINEIRVNQHIVDVIGDEKYKDDFEVTLVPKQERYLCTFVMGNHDECSVIPQSSICYYDDIEELSNSFLYDELSNYGFIDKDEKITSEVIERMVEEGVLEYPCHMNWTFENNKVPGLRSRFEAEELSKLEDSHYYSVYGSKEELQDI